jgi:hypothetical protein
MAYASVPLVLTLELAWSLLVFAHIRAACAGQGNLCVNQARDGRQGGGRGRRSPGPGDHRRASPSLYGLERRRPRWYALAFSSRPSSHLYPPLTCPSNFAGTNGEGIAEPLMAIVKNNRKGLGF